MTFYLKFSESEEEIIKKGMEEHMQETMDLVLSKDGNLLACRICVKDS